MKKTFPGGLESILDVNSNNIWILEENDVAELWEISRHAEELGGSENKLLNIIRLAFEVFHYDPNDQRDVERYEGNQEYCTFQRALPQDGCVAVKKRLIRRITDITYENIKHLTTTQLLQLIKDNFGGGWNAIPLQIKDIIESSFEVSTTTLPARRMHAPGGTLDRKVADGFEVLEIEQGMWIEAIFLKKKEVFEKVRIQDSKKYDEEGNLITPSDDDDGEELLEDVEEKEVDDDTDAKEPDEETIDETYYETYISEADEKQDEEEEM